MARIQHIGVRDEIRDAIRTQGVAVPLCGKKRWRPRTIGENRTTRLCRKCADAAAREYLRVLRQPVVYTFTKDFAKPTDLPLAG